MTNFTRDQIEIYDQGVHDWVASAPLDTLPGQGLMVVSAPPERAFGAMSRVLAGPGGTPNLGHKTVPLPFASYTLTDIAFDQTRFRGKNTILRRLGPANGGLDILRAKWPVPHNFSFQIEIWARTRQAMNQYASWQGLQFESHEFMLELDLGVIHEVWGKKLIPVRNDGAAQTTEFELEESKERTIRYTQRVTVEGWLLPPVTTAKTVKEILAEWWEYTDTDPDGTYLETTTLA